MMDNEIMDGYPIYYIYIYIRKKGSNIHLNMSFDILHC